MRLNHLQQRVGRRMGVAAAGVVLERGLGGGPAPAEAIGQLGDVGIARHAGRHALRSFKNLRGTGKAVLREVGRHQPGSGGVRRVQLLAVGRRAQELPKPGRLRAGRAEGVLHLTGVQPQQLAHSGGGGQRAGRSGRVKHLVVRATEEFTDANTDLVARHAGRQQLLPAGAQRLRGGQRGRKNHRGRVKHRAVVHIVLLGQMRGGGVGHGGQVGTGARAVDDDFSRARLCTGRAHGLGKARDACYLPRTVASDGRTKPVNQQVLGTAQHRLGNRVKTQVCGEGSELGSGRTHENHSF